MKYLLLIYNDHELFGALPQAEYDQRMEHCVANARELATQGRLLGSARLDPPASATTVRIRDGQLAVTDGPFAETKEYLAGYNVIEARDLNEAIRLAGEFPWARTGSVEVRPIAEMILDS
jgi:hypothetical protein